VPVEPFTIRFRTLRNGPDTLSIQYDTRQSNALHGEHYTMGIGSASVQMLMISWDRFRWSVPVTLQ
jgi:hypothetical protein